MASRARAYRYLQRLQRDKAICVHGATRNREYTLRTRFLWMEKYALNAIQGEDVLWSRDIRPLLGDLPPNVLDIWQYGFTEMMNNALEHSAGQSALVSVTITALNTKIMISDDGEGIFKKLKRELGLADERHAVLELGKGKVTTDPAHHTGEGIFFTSKMFDGFSILSGNVSFMPHRTGADWIHKQPPSLKGTRVFLDLNNNVVRTPKEVFDQFTSGEEYGFTKTIVPVQLAQYGDEKLVSRSQAKRLLAGMERFKVVVLDFEDVDMIGQAFADEVFRIFANAHPDIELMVVAVNTPVEHMIRHVAGDRAAAFLGDEEA